MELVKFSNQLGGKDPTQPPFRIPAKDLDSNFAKLRPLPTDGNARQYAVEETPDGWFLRLFPDVESPSAIPVPLGSGLPTAPSSGTYVLGSINGTIQWLETEACA
jgi:hypothetical protein